MTAKKKMVDRIKLFSSIPHMNDCPTDGEPGLSTEDIYPRLEQIVSSWVDEHLNDTIVRIEHAQTPKEVTILIHYRTRM